jgi:beta-lactamase regulating signal transducer with metallopeptidase domain
MSEAILAGLGRASWQGGLVLLFLWCLCRILETRRWLSADIRCWLWRIGYIKLMIALVMAEAISLPLLPPPDPPQAPPINVFVKPIGTSAQPVSDNDIVRASPTAAKTVISASLPHINPQTILFALYLAGIGICFIRVFRAGLRTLAALRAGVPDTGMEALAKEIALSLGLRKQIPRILRSPTVTSPVYVAGAVLLPITEYTPEVSRLILAHELAHARRRDLVWEWLGTLTQALFFFHPLVLIARREERLARESAADVLALRITQVRSVTYGKLLLDLSLNTSKYALPFAGTVGAIENAPPIRRRLIALMEVNKMPLSRSHTIFLTSAAMILVSAVVTPWRITKAQPTDPQVPDTLASSALPREPKFPQLGIQGHPPVPSRVVTLNDVHFKPLHEFGADAFLFKHSGLLDIYYANDQLILTDAKTNATVWKGPAVKGRFIQETVSGVHTLKDKNGKTIWSDAQETAAPDLSLQRESTGQARLLDKNSKMLWSGYLKMSPNNPNSIQQSGDNYQIESSGVKIKGEKGIFSVSSTEGAPLWSGRLPVQPVILVRNGEQFNLVGRRSDAGIDTRSEVSFAVEKGTATVADSQGIPLGDKPVTVLKVRNENPIPDNRGTLFDTVHTLTQKPTLSADGSTLLTYKDSAGHIFRRTIAYRNGKWQEYMFDEGNGGRGHGTRAL